LRVFGSEEVTMYLTGFNESSRKGGCVPGIYRDLVALSTLKTFLDDCQVDFSKAVIKKVDGRIIVRLPRAESCPAVNSRPPYIDAEATDEFAYFRIGLDASLGRKRGLESAAVAFEGFPGGGFPYEVVFNGIKSLQIFFELVSGPHLLRKDVP
jgi:hypothetical protein